MRTSFRKILLRPPPPPLPIEGPGDGTPTQDCEAAFQVTQIPFSQYISPGEPTQSPLLGTQTIPIGPGLPLLSQFPPFSEQSCGVKIPVPSASGSPPTLLSVAELQTNENTNLLLRQYFPRGTDLAPMTQAQLDQVSLRLNQRPRKTLGFETPADKLQASVASTI